MSLASLLLPSETVRYRSARPVKYGQTAYRAYLTNHRLILHRTQGILQRDDMVGFKVTEIRNYKYHEEGLLSKRGVFTVDLGQSNIQMLGNPQDLRQMYQIAVGGATVQAPPAFEQASPPRNEAPRHSGSLPDALPAIKTDLPPPRTPREAAERIQQLEAAVKVRDERIRLLEFMVREGR